MRKPRIVRKVAVRLIFVFLMLGRCSLAFAEERDWRLQSVETIEQAFPDGFRKITWAADRSLWLAKADIGYDQSVLADQLCIFIEAAGKPKGHSVVISVIDWTELLQGNLVRLGTAICE